jgi:hypothetical protein
VLVDQLLHVGISRLWGGVHWRFDDPAGQKQGVSVARYVFDRALEPRDD